MTEFGWLTSTDVTDPSAVSFDRQAHYLTNMLTRLATHPEVEVACWYTSRSYDETTHEGSFGLMLPDFTRKPSFYAYQNWVAVAGRSCPPSPMNLSISRLVNGVARLGFDDLGFTYSVQASSNLTDWVTLVTNLSGTNGNCIYDDVGSTNVLQRFYRVSWP
jgi:hypothetical protein